MEIFTENKSQKIENSQYRALECRQTQLCKYETNLQPVAKVDADIYRILNANVAVIFKPFSFVKDFRRGGR